MKIIVIPFLSILQEYAKKEYVADAVGNVMQQQLDKKQALRTRKGEDNSRVHFLINKFKSGKKLTPDEMSYLRQNAKGIIDQFKRISREREVVEKMMRVVPLKMDVQNVIQLALQQIAKHLGSEERVVSAMQIANAQYEYMQTEEYKDKPNGPFDNSEKPASSRLVNKSIMQHTIMAIVAYEQAKLGKSETPRMQ